MSNFRIFCFGFVGGGVLTIVMDALVPRTAAALASPILATAYVCTIGGVVAVALWGDRK